MARQENKPEAGDDTRGSATTTDTVVHIVDDDPLMCKALAAMVDAGGWRYEIHGSAEPFLAETRDHRPGCVLLDMRMPGMNGLDCLREMKKRDWTLPVVMVTAHADVELAV
jgi:two-component system response regulator FixJ